MGIENRLARCEDVLNIDPDADLPEPTLDEWLRHATTMEKGAESNVYRGEVWTQERWQAFDRQVRRDLRVWQLSKAREHLAYAIRREAQIQTWKGADFDSCRVGARQDVERLRAEVAGLEAEVARDGAA